MLRIRQVKINILNNSYEDIRSAIASKLKINNEEVIDFKINKQSIDAREKNNILYVYELDVNLKNENKVLNKKINDVLITPNEEYKFEITGNKILNYRPVIIGSGPAGLYTAYIMAQNGFKPIIFERGEDIDNRIKTVNKFWEMGKLNIESNVQFGEGGAGTFSDGKLNTLVKDSKFRNKKVLEIFVENGAPDEILYVNKPHIGTDLLRDVVKNIRNKIIAFGGEFRFNSCLTNINI